MSEIHPGSWLGDGVEEFKKLPPAGKVGVGAVFLGVAGLAFLAHRKAQANGTSTGLASPGAVDTSGAAGGTQSPFPMVGGLPLLPSGVNPIFNPSTGDTIGYQSAPPATSAPPPSLSGNPIIAGPVRPKPLIPYGGYKGPSYSNLKPGTKYTYSGVQYTLSTTPNSDLGKSWVAGNLYGTNPQGQQVLLYGNRSAYGDGGPSTAAMMQDPTTYMGAAIPHLTSAVPQKR